MQKRIVSKETREKMSQAQKRIGNRPPVYYGNKASNWQGGKIKRTGYWYIHKPEHPFAGKQKYVAEHRLVMEEYIGRFLKPKEVVHHINHIITDNRIENLKLYATHGQHTKEAHPEIAKKSSLANKGKRRSPKTEFKKGMTTWNRGLTGEKNHMFGRKKVGHKFIRTG